MSLIAPEVLADRLGGPGLRIVDVSWYQAHERRDARREFVAGHLPGAVHLPLEAVSDPASPLPHTLPKAAPLAGTLEAAGIGPEVTVVVYDATGFRSAPRLWWLLRWLGHRDVAVLDGGLHRWRSLGLPLATGEARPSPASEHLPRTGGAMPVIGLEALVAAHRDRAVQIVDARPADRFLGQADEPRPGLRRGHIPGSVNLPLADLLEPETRCMKPEPALATVFADRGVDLERPIAATCGSGVAAAGLVLAAERLGGTGILYDGSWCEWGGRADLPIAGGEPNINPDREVIQ